jgi:tetratricopeptide (TPR) repeat protein
VALAGLVVVGVAAVLVVSRLNEAERYRRLVLTGEQALAAGNTYLAIETFSGAIALRADSVTSHLRRGDAYRAQRRFEDAARDYREAARLQPGAIDPLLALAALEEAQANAAGAAEWYAQAASIDRQSPTLLYRLALTRFRSGQPAAAVEPLRQAITLEPGFDEALYLLGVALRDLQDTAGATDALERAVRANPSLAPAREELADLYRALGRSADEMTQLLALSTRQPGRDREIAIGLAQAAHGDFEAARATFAAAETRHPGDSHLALARGRVILQQAESSRSEPDRRRLANEALVPLEQALGGTVRRSEGLAAYGRALHLSGDPAEATRLLREAVTTTPFARDAFQYLAEALAATGNFDEARVWLSRFDVLAGPQARAERQRRLGEWSLRVGDYRAVRGHLDPLATAESTDVALLTWSAEAHWHTGDADGARSLLARAAALAPRDPAVRRLRTIIR